MGLIKAAIGAAGGVLADQWKEYIYCESLPADVLVAKGQKRISSRGRSSNTSSEDNVITNGSVIAVNEGQCMIIVENGKVVDICSEAGEYRYDTSLAPSLFTDGLSEGVKGVFQQIGKRFTFGGDPGQDQRVYFFNTKEIMGNKYGTPSSIAFKIVDTEINFRLTMSLRCFGEYSYRITNPILFYTNICGNVEQEYRRDAIDSQLKSDLLTALQPAFAKLSAMRIGYDEIYAHTMELADSINEVLSQKWGQQRGIEIVNFGISSIKASDEDEERLKEYQSRATLMNANMRTAYMAGGVTEAMQAAAQNESAGPAMAFMGMGMAQNAGMMNMQGFGQQPGVPQPPQPPQSPQPQPPQQPVQPAAAVASEAGSWTCSCGAVNKGKFCTECGSKKPSEGWTCSCGTLNKGKFCSECGAKKPAGVPVYRCDKCGWEPENPAKPPKFCPECGDVFDENDIRQPE
ncbi:SPFH domain-containing protein [Anaerovibrio sp.]|uniref:SPFH domain-containing protein n=1 Tax=Anaerovibrio sp. TaxID=1872532 RepID=UPI003F147D92